MITSKSIGMKLRSRVKGKVQSRVFSFTPEGMEKLKLLREEYPERKKNLKYVEKYSTLLEDFGFQKKRVTYNFGLYWSIFLCALRREWSVIKELYAYEMSYSHNVVTDEGDALIADHMSETDARTLVDNTNGHIAVGTGWTGTTPKQNLATNTPTGSPEVMDATYPKLKGTWGAADDNVVQYRSTFEAGDLTATGIDEAGLGNNAVEATGDNLAYGQITPTVDVAVTDTLQVDWEHSYLGA